MSFRDALANMVEKVGGGLGAVIMGYDGMAIEEFIKQDSPFDVQLLAVEYATLLNEIKRTVEVLKTGDMEEITICTGLSSAIVRVINDDFFVILALAKEGNHGKGRFLLRCAVPGLREQLQ